MGVYNRHVTGNVTLREKQGETAATSAGLVDHSMFHPNKSELARTRSEQMECCPVMGRHHRKKHTTVTGKIVTRDYRAVYKNRSATFQVRSQEFLPVLPRDGTGRYVRASVS